MSLGGGGGGGGQAQEIAQQIEELEQHQAALEAETATPDPREVARVGSH